MTELQATIDPVLIPIKLDSEIPEWACIELNGELLVPKDTLKNGKENPVENTMIPSESFELGSVRFVNKVCYYYGWFRFRRVEVDILLSNSIVQVNERQVAVRGLSLQLLRLQAPCNIPGCYATYFVKPLSLLRLF